MFQKIALLLTLFIADVAHADVYLSKQEALDLVLGKECTQHVRTKEIPEALANDLDEQRLSGMEGNQAYFFDCEKSGKVTGYALIDSQIGKHLPITYIVGITPEGRVTRVEVLVFREIRGWEVRERKFMEQFEGKAIGEKLEVGEGIDHISGATLSSLAMSVGVRRALIMWRYFFKDHAA